LLIASILSRRWFYEGYGQEVVAATLLKSYDEFCKLKPLAAEFKIIFYYGVRSIPRPWSLVKSELRRTFWVPGR
jgi:hypothetical protein